jgi:fructan beta-fructosidase
MLILASNRSFMGFRIIRLAGISIVCMFFLMSNSAYGQQIKMKVTHHYLNIPIGYESKMKMINLDIDGKLKREIPVRIAEDTIGYWIYIDISEFKGKDITLSCPAPMQYLNRIYQSDEINGYDSLYKESNRPQFHFTVKRGWNNDVNGPIYFKGQYHLFWQAYPFDVNSNVAFMYWGHAVSPDLLHWTELDPSLILDSLGSPWSGTAVIDHNNDGGWGKDALVIFYACYDRLSSKQVQCVAYSNDNGKTFKRITGNPVIDSNRELGTNDTRDPKVFWYEPTKRWVMVLFEEDGMSFYNSTDMKKWTRKSHFKGLWECPDFFELPVDGDVSKKKWVIHGGSTDYFIGTFNGEVFKPESEKLQYAEGVNESKNDLMYAAESFENMPDNRRVQMAWGRIVHEAMPFNQMILFPTEFSLRTTPKGIRLMAEPIVEINQLHKNTQSWNNISLVDANQELNKIKAGPLHIKMKFSLAAGNRLSLRYQGNVILDLASTEVNKGNNELEILIDKTVVEFFLNHGERYIVHQLVHPANNNSLEIDGYKYGPEIKSLNVYEMKSIWDNN